MGVRAALAGVARGAPVPVFVVGGAATAEVTRALRRRPEIAVVDSPRPADVLVVVTPVPEGLEGALQECHDQLSPPRATVSWPAEGGADVDGLAAAIVSAHRDLLSGRRPSEAPLLPDEDPVEWRGVGPYGHGGKGMTGGTPYGRPLTGRAPDRDGLELDQVAVTMGPFLPPLPPGLMLDVKLQGDVVQEVGLGANPFPAGGRPRSDVFGRALGGPVPIAEVELARARHHLAWLGDALRAQGLGALGLRATALGAAPADPDGPAVAALTRAVRRSGVLAWSLGGARLDAAALSGRALGPVARASGVPADARHLDPAYAELGFETVTHGGGDTRARWEQRLAEIDQSLELAGRAGDRRTTRTDVVESPRGAVDRGTASPSAGLVGLVPQVMTGLEWGDAVAAVVSLDLDVAEAAQRVGGTVPA